MFSLPIQRARFLDGLILDLQVLVIWMAFFMVYYGNRNFKLESNSGLLLDGLAILVAFHSFISGVLTSFHVYQDKRNGVSERLELSGFSRRGVLRAYLLPYLMRAALFALLVAGMSYADELSDMASILMTPVLVFGHYFGIICYLLFITSYSPTSGGFLFVNAALGLLPCFLFFAPEGTYLGARATLLNSIPFLSLKNAVYGQPMLSVRPYLDYLIMYILYMLIDGAFFPSTSHLRLTKLADKESPEDQTASILSPINSPTASSTQKRRSSAKRNSQRAVASAIGSAVRGVLGQFPITFDTNTAVGTLPNSGKCVTVYRTDLSPMGFEDALWSSLTVQEHIECYSSLYKTRLPRRLVDLLDAVKSTKVNYITMFERRVLALAISLAGAVSASQKNCTPQTPKDESYWVILDSFSKELDLESARRVRKALKESLDEISIDFSDIESPQVNPDTKKPSLSIRGRPILIFLAGATDEDCEALEAIDGRANIENLFLEHLDKEESVVGYDTEEDIERVPLMSADTTAGNPQDGTNDGKRRQSVSSGQQPVVVSGFQSFRRRLVGVITSRLKDRLRSQKLTMICIIILTGLIHVYKPIATSRSFLNRIGITIFAVGVSSLYFKSAVTTVFNDSALTAIAAMSPGTSVKAADLSKRRWGGFYWLGAFIEELPFTVALHLTIGLTARPSDKIGAILMGIQGLVIAFSLAAMLKTLMCMKETKSYASWLTRSLVPKSLSGFLPCGLNASNIIFLIMFVIGLTGGIVMILKFNDVSITKRQAYFTKLGFAEIMTIITMIFSPVGLLTVDTSLHDSNALLLPNIKTFLSTEACVLLTFLVALSSMNPLPIAGDASSMDEKRGRSCLSVCVAGPDVSVALDETQIPKHRSSLILVGQPSQTRINTLRKALAICISKGISVGYCPADYNTLLLDNLTIKEQMVLAARLKGLPISVAESQISRFALKSVQNILLRTLMDRHRALIAIAVACLGNPEVLIVEEPFDLGVIRKCYNGGLIVSLPDLPTLQTSETKNFENNLIIINDDQIIFNGPLNSLAQKLEPCAEVAIGVAELSEEQLHVAELFLISTECVQSVQQESDDVLKSKSAKDLEVSTPNVNKHVNVDLKKLKMFYAKNGMASKADRILTGFGFSKVAPLHSVAVWHCFIDLTDAAEKVALNAGCKLVTKTSEKLVLVANQEALQKLIAELSLMSGYKITHAAVKSTPAALLALQTLNPLITTTPPTATNANVI